LLADVSERAQRDPRYATLAAHLRHAAETDRFGIIAHVLAVREGCTAERCDAFALFDDSTHVSANISKRTYETYVDRYVAGWPNAAARPLVSTVPPAQPLTTSTASTAAVPGLPLKPPGPDVFFPSAASIPPVNIMTAEPAAPPAPPVPPVAHHQTTTGSGAPASSRQPARKAAPVRKPVDLNSEAARTTPASSPQ
jgi:hypothetical protein